MPVIVLTEEQDSVLAGANQPVLVRRRDGTIVASISPAALEKRDPALSPEEIAEFQRRAQSPGPWYSTEELLRRVQARAAECENTK
jgi:hypothetical protein